MLLGTCSLRNFFLQCWPCTCLYSFIVNDQWLSNWVMCLFEICFCLVLLFKSASETASHVFAAPVKSALSFGSVKQRFLKKSRNLEDCLHLEERNRLLDNCKQKSILASKMFSLFLIATYRKKKWNTKCGEP